MEQRPSNSAAPFFVARPECAEDGDPHGQWDLVVKEEECVYEAFVTDSSMRGSGIAEIISLSKGREKRRCRLCRRLRSARSPLNQKSRLVAVVEEEKSEHEAFVTNSSRQSESVKLRKSE